MGSGIMCLAVLFLGMVTSTATVCLRGQTFGDNCEYLCHCAGGQACGADGSCSNGCADGWEGEYCQRGNGAAGKSSSTLQSTTDGSYSSSLALDGSRNQSFTRCSHTINQYQPWWQVNLGNKYVLFTVKIWNGEGDARDVVEGRECKTTKRGSEYRGTKSTTRNGFTCEDWSNPNPQFEHGIPNSPANSSNYCRSPDYGDNEPWCYTTEKVKTNRWDYCDVPWCQSKLKNFKIFLDNNLCHNYTGMVNFGKAIDIRCVTPVVGQVLKIQLMDSSTVLTLCEVNVQGFLYKECTSHHYGPNCNNRCQCANDVTCDDTTGACPSGCNDRFTGPYCNIGIPKVLKDGPSTPTSISVKWMYNRPHDSAYDAGKVEQLHLIYKDTGTLSSGYQKYYISPGLMLANVTGLKPSTQYSFYVQLTWSRISTASVAKKGPTATFRTASCKGYMVMPVIWVTSNGLDNGRDWPNRVFFVINAKVPGMISGCLKDLKVYAKKTTELKYIPSTKAGPTYTLRGLTAFTEYDIIAIVRSPDEYQKEEVQKIKTAEDVPSAPTIAEAGSSPSSITIRITPPDPPYGIITNYSIRMWKEWSIGEEYSFGPTNLTYTFHELNYNTKYSFSAKASTSAGFGAWSHSISITTVEKVPGPPDTLLAQEYTADSLVLVWTKPKYPNGFLTNYKVICTPLFSYNEDVMASRMDYAKESNPGPNVTQLVVTGLTPATEYNCSVAAQTSKGYGPSIWLRNWTKPEVPGPPNSLMLQELKTKNLVLVWTKPKYPNGILTNYKVICIPLFSYNEDVNANRIYYAKHYHPGPYETRLSVTGLTPATEYNCSVAAQTSKGYGPSLWLRNWTKPDVPGQPNTLSLEEHTTSSLVLIWTKPKDPNGILKDYKVICTPFDSYDEDVNANRLNYTKEYNPGPAETQLTVTGLVSATEYNCSVAAQTSKGYGPSLWRRTWTKPEEAVIPEDLFPSVSSGKTTDSTITVEVPKMPKSWKADSISKVHIAVEKLEKRPKRSTSVGKEEFGHLTDYGTAKKKGYPGYIAAELSTNFSGPFVIGDGEMYGGYYNAPLTKGQMYDVIFGLVFLVGGKSSVAYRRYGKPIRVGGVTSANAAGLAAGLIVGGLVVVAFIIIPVVIMMRKKRKENGEAPDTQLEDIRSPTNLPEFEHGQCEVPRANFEPTVPMVSVINGKAKTNLPDRTIKISDLTPYVKSIRGERAKEFKDEFGELPVGPVKSIKEAMKPENTALNRYKNIATYDHSRVILQPIGEEKSDYINASYIHGYDKENAYIASQGPLPDSVTATWRMIWQERCGTIIMLTKLLEMGKKKCEQYWPSQGRKVYGPFTVQMAEEYKFTDYEKRILKVTLKGEVRTVKYFHFTAWPDHDVPKFACSLLSFRANVLKETEYGKAPILVHCSAGVGRTGTFIGIDYLIRQGKAEKKVNFFECVRKMREQRPNMVQNEGQYTHIHDAILEIFKIGITNIQSANFPQKYHVMIKQKPGKQTGQLQNQYSILGAFTDAISPSEKALANMSKNRKQSIIPDGSSRVILSIPVDGWDDYVNAVYATGYGEKDTYIITQMPFPETMKDIWRIVSDTGISTIVMMNLADDAYEFSSVYWPEETKRMEYGPLVVEGLDVDTSNSDITVRDFRISKMARKSGKGGKTGRLVRHFQLQNWPNGQATPSSPESIVELLEMVEKWQQKVENKKILVQCLDGASQSGVFCVAHSVIEKVKVDHEVDVFQYLRLLRTSRPQLVNTYEQYKFIHEVVLRYLQGFDIYANFK